MRTALGYVVALFLADSGAGGGIDLGVLAQYGVLGVFATILVVFAKGAYQREKDRADGRESREGARADRLEAEVQRLNALIQDRVIGVVASATSAVEESTELMTVMAREQIAAGHRDRVAAGHHNPRREDAPP